MKPGPTFRIARWEARRSLGSVDRRVGLALLLTVLLLAALVPAVLAVDPAPGRGLYRVRIQQDSPYSEVVKSDPQLRLVQEKGTGVGSDAVDILVRGTQVYVADTEKGRAAASALRQAIIAYNDRLMRHEPDRAAAFPVQVTLTYLPQAAIQAGQFRGGPGPVSGGEGPGGGVTSPSESDGTVGRETTEKTDATVGTGGATEERPPPETGGQSTPDGPASGDSPGSRRTGDGALQSPFGGLLGTAQSGTPSSLSPPFPLRSLLLAFVFLLPLNVIIQAYGSSIVEERIDRRGEPLLVSPISRGDIVLGKTLPYLLLAVATTLAIALGIGGGLLTVLAITPLAALFLAATFLAGMLARSFKELTFVTVTISVTLTAYAFIPAVFAEVHPIAAISPLTIVVRDLQGAPIGWGQFAIATVPVSLSAIVLFVLGTGIYREEDMFTQRPIPSKALDALAAPLTARWRVGLWTALLIPFVLVAELFTVATLFVLPTALSIPVLLGAVAVIEEVAKSIHVFAGFERRKFDTGWRSALQLGAISGVGFFLGEKLLVITQLVGLPDLELGRVAFAPQVLGVSPGLLLIAPLVLHVSTASFTAYGASRSRSAYLGCLVVSSMVHLGYNLGVVSALA
ncbi:MAG: ABC transporter permease subunit [Halodesulfurarchaeum sp.]